LFFSAFVLTKATLSRSDKSQLLNPTTELLSGCR